MFSISEEINYGLDTMTAADRNCFSYTVTFYMTEQTLGRRYCEPISRVLSMLPGKTCQLKGGAWIFYCLAYKEVDSSRKNI